MTMEDFLLLILGLSPILAVIIVVLIKLFIKNPASSKKYQKLIVMSVMVFFISVIIIAALSGVDEQTLVYKKSFEGTIATIYFINPNHQELFDPDSTRVGLRLNEFYDKIFVLSGGEGVNWELVKLHNFGSKKKSWVGLYNVSGVAQCNSQAIGWKVRLTTQADSGKEKIITFQRL